MRHLWHTAVLHVAHSCTTCDAPLRHLWHCGAAHICKILYYVYSITCVPLRMFSYVCSPTYVFLRMFPYVCLPTESAWLLSMLMDIIDHQDIGAFSIILFFLCVRQVVPSSVNPVTTRIWQPTVVTFTGTAVAGNHLEAVSAAHAQCRSVGKIHFYLLRNI